ncbi:MAG TPA: hypothetical protein VLS94_08915 [Fusibacter sp.]|nr:hypothetical protein [Fusibacter sp.]
MKTNKGLPVEKYVINAVCSLLFGILLMLSGKTTSAHASQMALTMYVYFTLKDEIRNNKS